jgi:IS1 family transposase
MKGTGAGSVWTWTAFDADSKLMISWVVSDRSQEAADTIIADLKSRITRPIQLSSDGLPLYLEAVTKVFRPGEIDHAEVIKTFASSSKPADVSPTSAASRYSPGRMLSVEKRAAFGEPDAKHASTSFMERWNLTLRMQNRRFTRLTNAFSKKLANHAYMLAISMAHFNFCRKHSSLKGDTPAMAAGLTSYRWTASDMLSLMWSAREAA